MKNNSDFSSLFYFNERDHIKLLFDFLSSANVGIGNGTLINCINETNMPKFNMLTLEIPSYMNLLHKKNIDINFHVSGYDYNSSQAIYRVLGEMNERYASIHGHTLLDSKYILKGTYNDLKNKFRNDNFFDINNLKYYSNSTYKKMSNFLHNFSDYAPTNDTNFSWFQIYNIKDDSLWWIPMQFFFQGYSAEMNNEKSFLPLMSTGTAAHITFNKALLNSLIESIQINDFNNAWYYDHKIKEIILNDIQINKEIQELLDNVDASVRFYLLQSEEKLITILCVLESKSANFPQFSFGIQSSNSKYDAIIRSLFEAAAVYRSTFYTYIYDEKSRIIDKNIVFNDLDKNVQFWAMPINKERNLLELNKIVDGKINYEEIEDINLSECELIKYIIKELKSNNKNIFIYNITPPEICQTYFVTRVFIPEHFPIFLPDFPYEYIKKEKLMSINKYVHPLP